jgi:hypothetical protein
VRILHFDWRRDVSTLRVPPTLLDQFVAVETDDGMLRFAKRFGPLGFANDGERVAPPPLFGQRGERKESLAWWFRWQAEFRTLLTLAALLREGNDPHREIFAQYEEWRVTVPARTLGNLVRKSSVLEKWSSLPRRVRHRAGVDLLNLRTRTLIERCGLRPTVTFNPTASGLSAAFYFQDATADGPTSIGLSLFGALTVQLLAAMTYGGFAICSGCGSVFVPRTRRPAFGRRRYCPRCGRRAAVRDAKADHRRKKREASRN